MGVVAYALFRHQRGAAAWEVLGYVLLDRILRARVSKGAAAAT